jgi:hypothetical protein
MTGWWGELEMRKRLTKNMTPWMTQTQMPQVDAGDRGSVELRRGWDQGVQLAMAITSEDHRTSGKILDRKTERVKFNGNIVVTYKCTD